MDELKDIAHSANKYEAGKDFVRIETFIRIFAPIVGDRKSLILHKLYYLIVQADAGRNSLGKQYGGRRYIRNTLEQWHQQVRPF